MRDIAIITTPLQARYFGQICKSCCDVYYLCPRDHAKHRFYVEYLKKLDHNVRYMIVKNENNVKDIYSEIQSDNINTLWVASIDYPELDNLIKQANNFYTFDDGSMNIAKRTKYHHDVLSDIRSAIKRHYTYFNPEIWGNIITDDRLIYETLSIDIDSTSGDGDIHILIEQPHELFRNKLWIERLKYKHRKLEYYIPHPRADFEYDLKKLDSDMITEDLVVELLKKYNHVFLYTWNSTSKYILSHPRVTFIEIDGYDEVEKYLGIY